ncbi:MAG: ATP-binding cassette domain-containing protein [Rhodospirillaceae bacterium]|jgi:phospholipid/cholesterol/gamma-HCH transport system ATP-binding protein|nr:ATP-binding cassette domain-containing protein [Rhodospirillaceae bacterium]
METNSSRPAEIRVTGLHKAFGEHRVLQGIDLTVNAGDVMAIVGGSGCGKTVLLNHILGQLDPDAGSIELADHDRDDAPLVDLADMDTTERDLIHQHWGMVFQRNALFSGSVYDNIALWLMEIRDMEDADIMPIARRVLSAVALPSDDAFIESEAEALSGGMAKRLAVARALAMNPVVIFYDEPTTGLDPVSATQIQDLIAETHEEFRPDQPPRTTVIITHDKDLLRRLEPRTVMLHEGRVFFDGPFAEFESASSPIIRPYFDQMPALHMADKR